MEKNLFVAVLKYIVSLETIETYRASHLKFLDHYYSQGIFVISGPLVPRTGGIIIAKCATREEFENILKDDPFSIHGVVQHEIYEFTLTKCGLGIHF